MGGSPDDRRPANEVTAVGTGRPSGDRCESTGLRGLVDDEPDHTRSAANHDNVSTSCQRRSRTIITECQSDCPMTFGQHGGARTGRGTDG